MSLSDSTRQQIESVLGEHKVVLFMKGNKHFPQCGFSARVIKMLKETGAPYHTVNVLSDPDIRDGIKEYSDWPTIPQLYVDKEFLGGCDIVTEMFEAGELQEKLGAPAPAPSAMPTVTITAAAATALAAAAEGNDVLHLGIDDSLQYELFFGPAEKGDLVVTTGEGGMTVHFDRASAPRAHGIRIDYVAVDGKSHSFRIDNTLSEPPKTGVASPSEINDEPARVKSMQVEELKALLASSEPFHLSDVRTAAERAQASLDPRAVLFDEARAAELGALPKDAKLVFHCHHGGRSRGAAERLVAQGFENVFNVEGGIDAWSQRIDSNVPRY